MTRKRKDVVEAETAAVTPKPEEAAPAPDASQTDMVDTSAELTPGPKRKAPPKPVEQREAPPPPKVRKYQVMNGGKIVHRGAITLMRPGKVVDEAQYNVEQLKEQGIKLEEL